MAEGFTRSKATSILLANIKETTYIGLSTTTPNEEGGGFAEPSGGGYVRAKFGEINTDIKAQIANKKIIFIFESEADCGSVTHVGLFDVEKNGVPFLVAKLTAPITVGEGYVPLIRARKLVIGLDKEALEPYAEDA